MFKWTIKTNVWFWAGLAIVCSVHPLAVLGAQGSSEKPKARVIPPTHTCQGTTVPGEVLIRFVRDLPENEATTLVNKIAGSRQVQSVRRISANLNVYLVRLRGETTGAFFDSAKADAFRKNVLAAEPNLVMRIENSDYNQWALRDFRPGVPGISAVSAWGLTKGSKKVVVGIIDTGIDRIHPDLKRNLWEAPSGFIVNFQGKPVTCAGASGWNAIDHNCNPQDSGWHGTHVSGIIGAQGGNFGVDGVNWEVSLMAIKAFKIDCGSVASVVEAIEFAIQAKQQGVNVRVLNNSYGQRCEGSDPCPSTILKDKIELANSNDILFVSSAGETGPQHDNDEAPHYPSSYKIDNVIAVAWTNTRDELSEYSNYGLESVDLGAPGSAIWSTFPLIYSGRRGYYATDGTSMATPFVSGTAALALSRCPNLSTIKLKELLMNTVDPVRSLNGKTVTGGRLNAYKAVAQCR